jgi:hypothetical protein
MSKEKWTPGPWRFEADKEDGMVYVCHPGTDCPDTAVVMFEETREDTANAHLIASAPEMYHLLLDIKDMFLSHLAHENSYFGRNAEALGPIVNELLKKARGEA